MKKILFVLIFSIFTTTVFSDVFNTTYKKIPIPEDVNKKTSSPWNFYDDFETEKLNFNLNCGYQKKRTNNEPLYEFKKEDDGNTYIAVTAKHKQCREGDTDRSEITTTNKDAREKIVWFGMRMRLPEDFEYIDDRTLLWQLKHMVVGGSPLVAFRLYEENIIKIGGQYGGKPNQKWKDMHKYYLHCKYKGIINLKKKWCERGEDLPLDANQKFDNSSKYFNFGRNRWITFKVGTYTTKSDDGFIKVYLDDNLVFDYEGPTYEYSGGDFFASAVRFGIYRDAYPENSFNFKGYPDQTVHYDDFVVASDKKTLDSILKYTNTICSDEINDQCDASLSDADLKASDNLRVCSGAIRNDIWRSEDNRWVVEAKLRSLSLEDCNNLVLSKTKKNEIEKEKMKKFFSDLEERTKTIWSD